MQRTVAKLKRPFGNLHYEVTGSGPALLFAHGLGGNHLSWWQQVAHFAPLYTCVAFAHRGNGDLRRAEAVLDELGLHDLPLAGLAKEREELFLPDATEPIVLPVTSPALYLVQRLRDEAHRFAIGSHRKKRSAAIGANPLDEIAGIGAGRQRALLQHFGSARAVAAAGLSDLQSVGGVSAALAKKIFDFFHPGG